MAFADWDQLTSITREKVLPKIEDQIGKDHPLLGRLWSSIKLWNGGTLLEIPVKYRHNAQGGSYSGLDVLSTGQEQTRTRAKFSVKQIYQPIVLSNIDLAKNGGEKIADLMDTEMEEARESLTDKFCSQLFSDGTGNGSKDLTGLKAAVGNDGTAAANYGDIVLGTYTWFKGNYTASVGSLMLSDLATMYDSCKSGQDSPSIIVTTEIIWSAYEALLQPQVRFQSEASGYNSGDGGMKALSFRGVPVIADEYCGSTDMYFINEKYLKLYYMKHPKFPTDAKGFAVTPLRDPVNQDGQVGFIFWYGQLVNSNPRRSGRLTGVTA
jgi:hypothetical protein